MNCIRFLPCFLLWVAGVFVPPLQYSNPEKGMIRINFATPGAGALAGIAARNCRAINGVLSSSPLSTGGPPRDQAAVKPTVLISTGEYTLERRNQPWVARASGPSEHFENLARRAGWRRRPRCIAGNLWHPMKAEFSSTLSALRIAMRACRLGVVTKLLYRSRVARSQFWGTACPDSTGFTVLSTRNSL